MNKKLWIIIASSVAALAILITVLFVWVLPNTLFKDNASSKDENSETVSASDSAGTVAFTVGSAEGKNGDIVSIPVNIDSNSGFMATLFDIKYDSEVLEYVTHEPGDIVTDYQFEVGDDRVSFLGEANSDVTETGTIFTLKFKVIGEKGDKSDVSIDFSGDMSGIITFDEEDVSHTAKDGTVTVK